MDLKTFILGLCVVIFIVILGVLASQGTALATQLVIYIFGFMAFLVIVGLIILAVWYLKFYHPSPILSKVIKDDKLKSAHISVSPHLRDLWLRGDTEHQGVFIGRITGWTTEPRNVMLGKDWIEISKEEKEKLDKLKIKKLLINESYFAIKPRGLFSFLAPEEMVVAIEDAWEIKEDKNGKIINKNYLKDLKQHSACVGDVELYGCALNKVGRYFYLPNYASSPMVDQIQTGDVFRKLSHYVQDELAGAVDRAMRSNVQHQIELERQKLIDLSKNMGKREGEQ